MPYIKRDKNNQIALVSMTSTAEASEFVSSDNPELLNFWDTIAKRPTSELDQSDTEVARIFEDLIDILIAKGVIQFTDLPEPAQRKLIKRQTLRKKISKLDFDADHDDDTIKIG